MSWPLVKLKDIAELINGDRSKNYPSGSDIVNSGILFLNSKNIVNNKLDLRFKSFITQEKFESLSRGKLERNDLVITLRGTLGSCCIFNSKYTTGFINAQMMIIRPNSRVDVAYLYYFITSSDTKNRFERLNTGSAVPQLTGKQVGELEIPLPPLEEQKRIAAILDKADAIRQKRKQAIELADEFLRSVFLDMFGDPVTNPKGWEVRNLQNLTSKLGSGSTPRGGKEAYLSEGISLIRSLNVHDNTFIYKDLAFISNEQAEKLKNVVVQEQDILLNITGASVCRCTIVPNNVLPARVNQHVCIIRVDRALLLPEFAKRLITSTSFKQMLLRIATSGGATREALTKQQVENLSLIVPPMELQKKFCDMVGKVLDVDTRTKKQVAFPLFDSLSQKAFSGQL
ncbi:restriction endonuclease subunit S [Photobacterium damselae subsp. damselae]|uniref:restriction endonuclease subunit S n=1 Tax=Photobacterium damselae TaxID=38293 RepID=UPI00311AFEC9